MCAPYRRTVKKKMTTAITMMPIVSARSARLRAASTRRAAVGSPGGFGISDWSTLLIVGDAEGPSCVT